MESEKVKNSEALGSKSMNKSLPSKDFRAFLKAYKARFEAEWEAKKKLREERESNRARQQEIYLDDDFVEDNAPGEVPFEGDNTDC